MQYTALIQDAQGKPLIGAKAGIVAYNKDGYSLEDPGWWGDADSNGYINIYFSGSIAGKVLTVWAADGRTVGEFPAADMQGKLITLDTAKAPFPWLLLVFGAIGFYLLSNKKRKQQRRK